MNEHSQELQDRKLSRQRVNAVRTAWALAAVAILIFAAFVLSGVLGEAPGG
jgi:hypothetical protein